MEDAPCDSNALFTHIGFALGGEAGARLLRNLGRDDLGLDVLRYVPRLSRLEPTEATGVECR